MANENFNWLGNRVVDSGANHISTPRERSFISDNSTYNNNIEYDSGVHMRNEDNEMNNNMNESGSNMRNDNDNMNNNNMMDQEPMFQQGPPPVFNTEYLPGYLRQNIGRKILAEFVIGTNIMTDKAGTLKEVGVNYFIIEDLISGATVVCDLYSVKFVTIM